MGGFPGHVGTRREDVPPDIAGLAAGRHHGPGILKDLLVSANDCHPNSDDNGAC